MGGKSGGGQSTPYEAPNTLSSAQSLRIIDAISEGVVSGFANGDDTPFKSVFFDDTPVQNADGSFNYKGVVGFFQRGLQEQTYVPGFDASERTVAVSAGVKQNTPIVRTVTDALVTRLRITVGVERNAAVQDNGDTLPANTSLQVELVNNQGVKAGQVVAFTEKGSGIYYQDVLFDTLPAVPFNIRVTRISPDSTTDRISNNTYFASYVEIIDAKLSYPHTAFAALAIDSDQFGNSVPRRNYLLKGRLVKVPSNYDPETRVYSGTTWDGSFKTAWTNNPAWVFYDVLTQPRFSTLARRLNVADIDKWSLYQIGRYCDELVDDGFGGKEPRFVCNAYISDLTQAGEFLLNLASVFTGLPVWNGSQISVVMDADSDPVALYNNSNVKDGLFTYSGAAYKSIHTAVHVQYIDKYDGYRTKTEYIADNDAVARYGLNIKQITAFGCDSRGQAARFGAWTLQTELRQQNMVSFEVGREGLKHLPYDIVQVMDNQYAGAELSGRITAVDGLTVTLDRDVPDIAGALFYYSGSDGMKSVKVAEWPAKNQVLLESADGISAGAGWAVGGKVKPRLFRAIGIKENSSDGTYTITGLLHDPKKYAAVDSWANFDREITTLHNIAPVLVNGNIATESGAVVISWDNLTASGQVLTYDIKIYRNNRLYRHTPDAKTAEIRLENLPNGDYKAEIRGRNARGSLSEPLIKAWSVDYNITGLRATPKTLAIAVDWVLPQTVVSELVSELWYSRSNDFKTAAKLASLPYPQNSYQLTGVGVSDTYYFWARAIDTAGNSGEFTAAVKGQADKDPAPIVAQVQGAITKSALSKDLIAALNADMATAADGAKQAAIRDAAAKIAAETQQRTQAIQAEAAARTAAIKVAADKAASDLTKTAADLGTKITAVENVNATQAQQISTVTAAQGQTAAGLEAEKKARADGDKAEAAERAALATRVGNAESNITKESQARTAADTAQVQETNALKTRVGSAEGRITTLQETVVENDRAATTKIENLTAQFGALAVGGRNLLRNSGTPRENLAYGAHVYPITEAPKLGEDVVITLWGELEDGRNQNEIWAYNGHGFHPRLNLVKIADGVWQGKGKWFHPNPVQGATLTQTDKQLNIYLLPSNVATRGSRIDRIKLERGNVGTDWTPAPEDTPDDVVTTATFESYKTAQAAKDKAQTDELNTAKSSIAGNTSEIANLKSTAATKDQVVSMARNGLQAEWTKAADDKATTAKNAAIAEAQKLNNQTNATVTALQKTVADNNTARAEEINGLKATFEGLQIGGRNFILASDDSFVVAANEAADKETLIKRFNIASGQDWSTVRTLALSVDVEHGVLTRSGSRWWRVGFEVRVKYTDNTYAYPACWAIAPQAEAFKGRLKAVWNVPAGKTIASVDYGSMNVANVTSTTDMKVSRPKLEIGNTVSDWSPAPEDAASIFTSQAEFEIYRTAQAEKDKAQTDEIASAKSLIQTAESEISTLKRTSITSGQAETIANDRIRASNQFADTRNDNRPPTWYWTNHPRQTVREFKVERAVGAGTGTTFCAVETVVPWADGSGGAITQTAYMNDGTVKRRKSDVTYTYSNNSYNYTKDAWTAWETDETVKGAQSKADAVKAIADAADRLSKKTDADFTQFKTAYANAELARAAKEEELTAKIENIQVGGLNLLKNSNAAYNSAAYSTRYELAEAPKVGEDVVITLWGSKGSDRTGIGVYNSYGFTEIAKLVEISEGVYQGKGKWSLPMRNGAPITPNNTHLNVYFYPNGATSANTIDRIKLERGTVGTDWTPAPEDASTDTTAKVKVVSDAVANLNGKVQAMHTVKVEAISGGRKVISGLALGADGQTGDSQMLVYANKFAIVDPTSKSLNTPFVVVTENGKSKVALDGDVLASGAVLGKHIAASQEIITPVLNSPTINTTTINGGHINIGNGNFVVDWHGNMFAKSGTFDGTVRAGMLTGNVLSSYEVIRTGVGTYSVYIPPIELDAAVLVQYLVTSGSTGEVNVYDAGAILGTRRWTVTRCNHHEVVQYVHSTPASWWLRKNIQPYVVMEAVTKTVTGLFRLSRGQGASVVVNVRDYHSNLIDASSIVLATVMPIK